MSTGPVSGSGTVAADPPAFDGPYGPGIASSDSSLSPPPELWLDCHRSISGSGLGTTRQQYAGSVMTTAGFEPHVEESGSEVVGRA